MSIYHREAHYINLLAQRSHSIRELSEKLFISEPTVRRDISVMKKKELVICNRGIVQLSKKSPDQRIPLFIRDLEQSEAKKEIALKATEKIKDGDVIMLDSSTTAFHILPHLVNFKNIFVITNGAKTALEAASMGIRTICTGGEITLESFCYVGTDAEDVLNRYNADIAFFSCRGITEDGLATDNSILENSIRRIMIKNSKQTFLLCDKSKFNKKYLNTLCNTCDVTSVISDI
ncbi:MAG: DeoR/GlpR family DNA-binding transcription regulator [Acutalibacteraceae bacterium]|nr:DeoR/GlpR family DNA-binding transcription regulator [Acutalibacteraceae bacterium]